MLRYVFGPFGRIWDVLLGLGRFGDVFGPFGMFLDVF